MPPALTEHTRKNCILPDKFSIDIIIPDSTSGVNNLFIDCAITPKL